MVAGLVSNKIKPNRCNCGESVAFNTPSVARHIQDAGFDNVITDATIRNFITTKQIGCVGKSTKFWGKKQVRHRPITVPAAPILTLIRVSQFGLFMLLICIP